MLLLCVTVLSLSMAQPAKAVLAVDDAALIIIASLAAFGIAVTAQGGLDEVSPWIMEQFEEYVESVGDTVSTVWDKVRLGVTKAGKLVLDGFTLRYNAKFGEWLVDKFGLSDNSSIDTSPPVLNLPYFSTSSGYVYAGTSNYYNGGGTVLSLNTVYTLSNGNTFELRKASTTLYFYVVNNMVVSSSNNGGINSWSFAYFKPNGSNTNSLHLFFYTQTSGSVSSNTARSGVQPNIDLSLFGNSFSSSPPVTDDSSVVINAGSISVPGVGDYDDDDGILIDGLGSWGDSLDDVLDNVGDLTLPGSTVVTDGDITYTISPEDALVDQLVSEGMLTTENSPGFFNGLPLISGIPDFSFGDLWHYVTDWVSSMSGGLSLIGGIMFSLPFVSAFYALVVILIVLSLWRLLRSA